MSMEWLAPAMALFLLVVSLGVLSVARRVVESCEIALGRCEKERDYCLNTQVACEESERMVARMLEEIRNTRQMLLYEMSQKLESESKGE